MAYSKADKEANHSPPITRDASDPVIPDSFDLAFIASQLRIIQGESSLVNKYFASLRARYTASKQGDVLTAMQDYFKVLANTLDLKAELHKKHRDLKLAMKDLETVDEDVEIQRLEKELKKAGLKRKIAEEHHKTDMLSKEQPKTKNPLEEQYEEKLERERIIQEYRSRLDVLRQYAGFDKRKLIEEEFERRKKEIFKNRRLRDLEKEDLEALDDLEDFKNEAIDRI